MGLYESLRINQAAEANKIAAQQLKEIQDIQDQSALGLPYPAQNSPYPGKPAQDNNLAVEIRTLNESVTSIAASLARLVEIFDDKGAPRP